MPPDRQRLARLQRLERLRSIAKLTAAREAAEAESALSQLQSLADRTGKLIADYALRASIQDGGGLRQIGQFAQGLREIHAATASDASQARQLADTRMSALAQAERRRAAVEERAALALRQVLKGASSSGGEVALGARPKTGTPLE